MADIALAGTELAHGHAWGDVLIVGPSLGTSVTALWAECAQLLSDRFEVIGWDLPGHGHSVPTSDSYSISDLADAVAALAATVRQGRRCWYAGVSLGGAVGLELALRDGLFDGIAVIASAATLGTPADWHERADLVRRAGTPVMVEPSAKRWFAPGFVDRRPEIASRLLESLSAVDKDSYVGACHALAEFDLSDRLGSARVPLLLVPGEYDVVVSVADADRTAALAPTRRGLGADRRRTPPGR